MIEKDKAKPLAEMETENLRLLHIIKTEANLAGLPFFALSRKDARRKTEAEYIARVERDGKILEVGWSVTPNVRYGYPGPFDRKVHKAIEHIINQRGIPIENPVAFSIHEIIRILGIKKSGRTYSKIAQALKRIVATTVDSRGTFFSKKKQQYINDTFHLYDRAVLKGETLPDGSTADSAYLFLSQWYLDNINAFYVRPIDFDYFRQLRSDIAGRLYELLGLKFHGVILNKSTYWNVEYKRLADLLPIAPQKYLSDAKRYLEPAHRELIKTRFLSKVAWDTREKDHWYIFYYPGKKAMEEARPSATQEELPLELPEQTSMIEDEKVSENLSESRQLAAGETTAKMPSDLGPEEEVLFSLLRARRIGRKSALEMVKVYAERIQEKIEIFDWAMEHIREKIQSPTGFLRRMIEEDWDPPEGFVTRAAQKRTQEETRARRQARKQKEKEEHFRQWRSMSPKQKVRGELWLWEHGFAREQGRKPTPEEMRGKEQELIASLPGAEEYRRRLFGDSG